MGFDVLSQHGATTVLMAHSSTFALGDWKQESNWVDSVDPVEEV